MKIILILVLLSSICLQACADDVDCTARFADGTIKCKATTRPGESGRCPGGYEQEEVEVLGYASDTWCTRGCTTAETEACDSENCRDYTDACSPSQPISCQLAVKNCKGEVSGYICSLAPNYRMCGYTEKCQNIYDRCCPRNEEKASYTVDFLNVVGFPKAKPSNLLITMCGCDDEETANALVAKHEACGGMNTQSSNRSNICRNTIGFGSSNRTLLPPDQMNATIDYNRIICQYHRGIYNWHTKEFAFNKKPKSFDGLQQVLQGEWDF